MSWADVLIVVLVLAFVLAIRSSGSLGGSRFHQNRRDDDRFDADDTFSRPSRSYSPRRSSGGSRASSSSKRASGSANRKK